MIGINKMNEDGGKEVMKQMPDLFLGYQLICCMYNCMCLSVKGYRCFDA